MKKIKYVLISLFILTWFVSFLFAHEENTSNPMQKRFQQTVMWIQNSFMEDIKSKVDEETAKKLDAMIASHRKDMKNFMSISKTMSQSEKMEYMMKMKKRHFGDLINILSKYPKLGWKYAAKMEIIMESIMKKRRQMQSWKEIDLSIISFTSWLPNEVFDKVDNILNRYYKKLSSLSKEEHVSRLNKVINKIDNILSKLEWNDRKTIMKKALYKYIKYHIQYHLQYFNK